MKNKLNIYALDQSPEMSAIWANDMHVAKMVTQTAQILCTVLRISFQIYYINWLWERKLIEDDQVRYAHIIVDSIPTIFNTESRLLSLSLHDIQRLSAKDPTPFLYKANSRLHPVVTWASYSQGNYSWLLGYFDALADEYLFRFKKPHLAHHKIRKYLPESILNISRITLESTICPPVIASPEICRRYFGHVPLQRLDQLPEEFQAFPVASVSRPPMPRTWDTVERCYREYYCVNKLLIGRWTNRPIPMWFEHYHKVRGAKQQVITRNVKGEVWETRSMVYPGGQAP